MLSSDYSAQEPRLTAFVSQDPKMIQSFKDGKDIYSAIASLAFNLPYEKCCEFHPETGEYQEDGKARRGEAKTIVLGICYGRSVPSIGDQLYGKDKTMSDEEKTKKAQNIYDAVLEAFPNLKKLMHDAQAHARKYGYVETILGRRRHIPDMQLPEFEFKPMKGYINPDVDPLDISTLSNSDQIPQRIVDELTKEFKGYKYFGQIVKRTKELAEEHIRVINNRSKIQDASRQCVNCVDYDTEILTTSGWKRYDEVSVGDTILSYSLKSQEIVQDSVQHVHIYPEDTSVVKFESPTFCAVSTLQHCWVVSEYDEIPRIKTTEDICRHKWPDYPIIRVANNSFEDNPYFSDDALKLIGWVMTDGSIEKKAYAIHLYQSTKRKKNAEVYQDMIATLDNLSVEYTDACRDGYYHEIYLKKNPLTKFIRDTFPDRILTFDWVSTLSQHQAEVVMRAMLQGDGTGVDSRGYPINKSRVSLCCKGEACRDVFQYLCYRAGYATNAITIDGSCTEYPSNHKLYASMTNIPNSVNVYYDITVLRITRAQIYPHHKFEETAHGVWCVTTTEGTWIARRDGKVYITGNSIIQGSAAEQTKLAMLLLRRNKRWHELGARLLLPVHDELIAEVPEDNYKEAAELLSSCMCEAASFLPFPSKCDVTITHRWYGMEYPCPYPQPKSLNNLTPNEIRWVQYQLVECEYLLPIIQEGKDKPKGDAAKGVNGIDTPQFRQFIAEYMKENGLHSDQEFIKHIRQRVTEGVIL